MNQILGANGKYPNIIEADIHAIEGCAQFSIDNDYRKHSILQF